jgi:hypothetical protein
VNGDDVLAATLERAIDIMDEAAKYLRSVAGSPAERKAFGAMFAFLAENGRGLPAGARERMEVAHAEREARVALRASCEHLTRDWQGLCLSCGGGR